MPGGTDDAYLGYRVLMAELLEVVERQGQRLILCWIGFEYCRNLVHNTALTGSVAPHLVIREVRAAAAAFLPAGVYGEWVDRTLRICQSSLNKVGA